MVITKEQLNLILSQPQDHKRDQNSYRTHIYIYSYKNKKAQLSLTNPRDAKACQKLL